MLTKSLAEHLFEAFSIQRWNDRMRIISLTEMDKNAFKAFISYFLAKRYEKQASYINWTLLIDRSVYDLVTRISTSDIGSAVHGKLRENKENYVTAISGLLEKDLSNKIINDEFTSGLKDYIANNFKGNLSTEDLILRLAHNLSVQREYEFISSLDYNKMLPDFEQKRLECEKEVEYYATKLKLTEYINSENFRNIKFAIDSLRFQERWSQTQRLPKTNVLGHSFYVSLLYYFSSRYVITDKRTFGNNFFSCVMHDFLEAYARDVINPVKVSSAHFSEKIREIEEELFHEKLEPILDDSFKDHFKFLITEEFSDRKLINGVFSTIAPEDTRSAEGDYADGYVGKVCDSLAALIEAHQSIEIGINSHHLQGAITRVYSSFQSNKSKLNSEALKNGFDKVFNDFIST
jgi:putative hydrolases of HD superfamily